MDVYYRVLVWREVLSSNPGHTTRIYSVSSPMQVRMYIYCVLLYRYFTDQIDTQVTYVINSWASSFSEFLLIFMHSCMDNYAIFILYVCSYYYAAMERQYLPRLDPSESVSTCNKVIEIRNAWLHYQSYCIGHDKIGWWLSPSYQVCCSGCKILS